MLAASYDYLRNWSTNPDERFRGTACARFSASMKLKLSVLVVAMAICGCLRGMAMDRWSALSQIESGDNDKAIGRLGEISRYQILPDVWDSYALEKANWENPKDALKVAKEAMKKRCANFEQTFHRAATDFEFYVLWNAPAQIQRPGRAVSERAKRFCNLLNKKDNLAELPKR
jgi:hypothetical protein